MAPTKKPGRTTNKRSSSLNEFSPEKNEVGSNKNKLKKRKLSDKSGSKWNDEELKMFYEAYRKYGKDWKKVAAVVSSKSVEMVEDLYKMNRAYLSLPEGIASVVGLIAMMTDYSNVLEESDSEERESNEVPRSQKPKKRKHGKNQLSATNDSVQSQSIACNDGSLLNRRQFDGSQPKAVGKRTPHVEVQYSDKTNDIENYVLHNKRSPKSSFDVNDDKVALALAPRVDEALTEAAQSGGSPHAFQKSYKISKQKFSPAQSRQRMHPESETVPAKFYDASFDDECLEDESSSRDALQTLADLSLTTPTSTVEYESSVQLKEGKKAIDKDKKSALPEGTSTSKKRYKTKLPCLKEKVDHAVLRVKIILPRLKEKVDHAVPGDNIKLPHLEEKVHHAVHGDKIKLPSLEEKVDHADPGVGSSTKHRRKRKMILQRPLTPKEKTSENILTRKPEKVDHAVPGDKIKLLRLKEKVHHAVPGDKIKFPCLEEMVDHAVPRVGSSTKLRSRHKMILRIPLTPKEKSPENILTRKPEKVDHAVPGDKIKLPRLEEKVHHAVPGDKIKLPCLEEKVDHAVPGDKIKLPRLEEKVHHAVPGDKIKLPRLEEKVDHAVPGVGSSTKHRSKRKMILQRPLTPKEKSSGNMLTRKPYKNLDPVLDRALFLKEKLCGCLSSYLVRRWCMFEWFYSAIDYPWFSRREFAEYLDHVDLGKIPKLTRVEWSVIKSSLGNPRRFSKHFLRGERQKFKQYRESVRKHYNELWTGVRDGLPIDLPKQLFFGQQVNALHSETRDIHIGNVLMVDHDKYGVQFDRLELGVEYVMDTECMPLNPLDNMPETLRRQIGPGSVPCVSQKPHMKRNSTFPAGMICVSRGPVEKASTFSSITLAKHKKDSNAMCHLRKHNTYMRNSLPPQMNPKASSDICGGPPRTMNGSLVQELGSTVVEIIKASRLRAHAMVNAAFQAYSSLKEGEDALMGIWHALDCADYQPLATYSRIPVNMSQEQMCGSFDYQNLSTRCSSEPLLNDAYGKKLHDDSDKVSSQIPLELITSCVATWILIQTCAVQQYPQAEVAQILDFIVTGLRPHSPGNLPLYREIQMSVGRIKTWILTNYP